MLPNKCNCINSYLFSEMLQIQYQTLLFYLPRPVSNNVNFASISITSVLLLQFAHQGVTQEFLI